MTIDERIEFLKTYINEFEKTSQYGYGYRANEYLKTCEKLKALGFNWGDKIDFEDFRIYKGHNISNSSTNYKGNDDDYYIHWDNGNVGCLMFVNSENCDLARDDYNEFLEKLRSYGAVDWDDFNAHIIFDIEHGKKLLEDYPKIRQETADKIKKKLKNEELAKAKRKYEQLLAESGGEISNDL